MWTGVACLIAAAWLLPGPAAAGQASSKPPANEDCLACHGDAGTKRDDGCSIAVEAGIFEASIHGPLACVDCHGDPARNPELPHATGSSA